MPKKSQLAALLASLSTAVALMLFLFAYRVIDQKGDGPGLGYMILHSPRDFIWVGHSWGLLTLMLVGLPVALAKRSVVAILGVELLGFLYAFFDVLWEMGIVPEKFDPRILHPALMANLVAWLCISCALAFLVLGVQRSRE